MATPVSPGVVSIVPLTGQNYIDSLLDSYKWGGSIGTGASLTYSFRSNSSLYSTDSVTGYGPSTGSGEPWKSGWSLLSDTQKIGIKAVLNAWADVANVRFTEVIDSSTVAGDIRFSTNAAVTVSSAYMPWPSATAGDVWFATSSNLNTSTKGTYGYYTFLHEIGHALGLDHPHEGRVIADPSIDALQFTVMSYRDFVGDALNSFASNPFPTTPMLRDIAAIQYLYGANMSTRSGDTTYSWTVGQNIYETIWDGGGNDTIDWSNQSSAAIINLNAGQWSYLGPARWDGHAYTQQNLMIAYNAVIENATGGAGNDTLRGNSAGNTLNGGAGNDQLYGGAGDDVFDWDASSRGGADTMYGGPGNDTYVIDSLSDVVVELAGEGTDVIQAAITYSIANVANVENLYLFGTQSVNATGNALANVLRGNDAANTLVGGAGADTLRGGVGNDTYVVDNAADTVTESANEGTDTVQASVSWTLGANLENLTLTGAAAINGTGNALDNVITGNTGASLLDGGAGVDTARFSGAIGSYKFGQRDGKLVVDGPDGHDTLVNMEFLAFGGSTPVAVSSLASSATIQPLIIVSSGGVTDFQIATPFSGTPIPGIRIDYQFLGTSTGEVAIGTDANDFMNLLGGDDAADGGAGGDILDGGIGSNFLSGGAGTDTFFLDGRGGTTTWSTITDWTAGEQLSVWGWNAASRVVVWRTDGATGYTGITMHADLNNDGTIDTSVTWAGKAQGELPVPGQFPSSELLWFT